MLLMILSLFENWYVKQLMSWSHCEESLGYIKCFDKEHYARGKSRKLIVHYMTNFSTNSIILEKSCVKK